MKKGLVFSILLGFLGALTSYLLIIVDTLTFGGNGLALLFLPFHIAIAYFAVSFRKPTVLQLFLRLTLFLISLVLLIESDLHILIYDIVMNYSATPPEIHVAIIFEFVAICMTLIIGLIVRISKYTKEKATT